MERARLIPRLSARRVSDTPGGQLPEFFDLMEESAVVSLLEATSRIGGRGGKDD